MTNSLENRRSFRVSESVYLKYEVLTEDEFRDGIEHRNLRLGVNNGGQSMLVDIEARLSEAMYLLQGEHGALGRCITLMNDKINIAIRELPGLRESKTSLANLPSQTCDVGADGMVFSSSEQLKVGDKLHLQFLLSTDSRYAETFCQVTRLTDPPATDSPDLRYGIAVEFVKLPPAQREILIQHMFNLESQTLRMRRLELESVESQS
jgi:c-di-GMP-binding flagellar brake protein YcgR